MKITFDLIIELILIFGSFFFLLRAIYIDYKKYW